MSKGPRRLRCLHMAWEGGGGLAPGQALKRHRSPAGGRTQATASRRACSHTLGGKTCHLVLTRIFTCVSWSVSACFTSPTGGGFWDTGGVRSSRLA